MSLISFPEADQNIRKLNQICARLGNTSPPQRSCSSQSCPEDYSVPESRSSSKLCQIVPSLNWKDMGNQGQTPTTRLQNIQRLFRRQIADLQMDLKKCVEELRKVEKQLRIQKQIHIKAKLELDDMRAGEATRLMEFRMRVEQEFLVSMSELLTKKDEEIEQLKNNLQQNILSLSQENLQLKHNIVHLKSELVSLEEAVDSLKRRRSVAEEIGVSNYCEHCSNRR